MVTAAGDTHPTGMHSCKRCVHLCFSSRPFTAQTPVPDDLTQSPLDAKTTLHKAKRPPHEILVLDENRDEISDLIFHTTDFVITPIVDNPKVHTVTRRLYGLPPGKIARTLGC